MRLQHNYYADGDTGDWYFPYRKHVYTNYSDGLRKTPFASRNFAQLTNIRVLNPYKGKDYQ